jgi:hypothetical protein
MTYNELLSECESIQSELETLIPDDINAAVDRGRELSVYHARTGFILAEAKKLTRAKKTTEIGETIIKIAKEQCLSSKAQNALVDSIATEEMYVADWADRLNSSCKHQLDMIRTIISKEKEEMRFSNFHGN